MKQLEGKVTLDAMTRVQRLEIGGKTYHFPNQPILNAGVYEVWTEGVSVEFVKIIDSTEEANAVIDDMLKNLRDRSEHN